MKKEVSWIERLEKKRAFRNGQIFGFILILIWAVLVSKVTEGG